MKSSMAYGLMLFSVLMALSMGVAFAQENEADNETPSIEVASVDYVNQSVAIFNAGDVAADMTNSTLVANNTVIFAFPEFELAANETVTVIAGLGENTETELYSGSEDAFFAQGDETVTLFDSIGNEVDTYPVASEEVIEEDVVEEISEEDVEVEVVEETTEVVAEEATEEGAEEATEEESEETTEEVAEEIVEEEAE